MSERVMRERFIVIIYRMLVSALLVVGCDRAAFGDEDRGSTAKGDPYRVAHRFGHAGEAETFLELLSRKEVIAVQMEVINQLAVEKRAELRSFNRQLEEVFDLNPDLDYTFDAETGRVFEAAENDPDDFSESRRVPSLILKDGPRRERFTKLALARNATKQQILAFNLVQTEKAIEMQETDRALERNYGVTTNGTFRYAAEDMTLYERVETP